MADTELLTTQEAAAKLGVSLRTIQLWCNTGYIKCYRTIGGHRRLPASELDRVLLVLMNQAERGDAGKGMEPSDAEIMALHVDLSQTGSKLLFARQVISLYERRMREFAARKTAGG